MDEQKIETDPTMNTAAEALRREADASAFKAALIAKLEALIAQHQAELAKLGVAKPAVPRKRKPGRPIGSRNKAVAQPLRDVVNTFGGGEVA